MDFPNDNNNNNNNNEDDNNRRARIKPDPNAESNRGNGQMELIDLRDQPMVVVLFLMGMAHWLLREHCTC